MAEPLIARGRARVNRRALALVAALTILNGCGVYHSETHAATPSAERSAGAELAMCAGDGFSVAYPAGWFVHRADAGIGVGECTLFAAHPFDAQREPDGRWTGAQIVLRLASGCQGSFEVVASEQELQIDGYPAWAREMSFGEGPDRGAPSAYEYTVNLAPHRRCETGLWFFGRTEMASPGDPTENAAILDRMMQTVSFSGLD